ncbi:hypothetical protein D1007_14361 [Hordeum vulgare]|nr:hypothetical protein D1007_14361 [Hordeum vulgare]
MCWCSGQTVTRSRGEAVFRVAYLWVCLPYASGFRSGQWTVKQETRGGAAGQKVTSVCFFALLLFGPGPAAILAVIALVRSLRVFLKMPRRKRNRTEPAAGGMLATNKVPIDGIERNRASPHAICKLYKHTNEDQRVAIRDMGTGPFLDIKRGFIPLTEESVRQILGIPHGDIDVKYEADYDNEDEIVSCLFPRDSSRPKITTVASKIMNNNNADATFNKLWLIYIVSTVLAPTTDTRISNKCHPMLVRLSSMYLDALDCDGMELELPDTSHTVNAWSKTHVDVVPEMDMLEHDPPSFGNFQKKLKATTIISKFASGVGTLLTEFELGVDKLLTELVQGLTAPTTSNSTNSRINSGADRGEREDTLPEDSSSSESDDGTDEDDADIEREKKKRNTREEHIDNGNEESPLMRNETESCDKALSGDPSA